MINKVILIGRLGRDPEVRYTQGGTPVANFSLATSERWTDRDGEKQEKTEWHNIVAWRKSAEICGEYYTKGDLVYVEGKLQSREWDDRDGNKKKTVEVVASQTWKLSGDSGQRHDSSSGTDDSIEDDDLPF